ncbi:MAG TPA: hypothetical protein DCX60_02400 [Phycisphaerales bacterium]|nr:hypothetical protein [Phycisphaerales bacterium]
MVLKMLRDVFPSILCTMIRIPPIPSMITGLISLALLSGCADPEYDTSTPQAAMDSMQAMVEDGRPDLLPNLIYLEPRDIRFDDGVTEESAIEEVRGKLSDMLAQLWRVTIKLRDKFPDEVDGEVEDVRIRFGGDGFGDWFGRILADPFGVLREQKDRIVVEDMYDGTAAVLVDDEPLFGGLVSMIETGDGWQLAVPVQYAQTSEYWPQTRYEWSVIASMLLAIENSLSDFEREIDRGGFRSLSHASERAGRLLGESVVVQSVIYAMMKRDDDSEE